MELINRMKVAKKDQLIFIPYSTMGHWLLLVIDMTSMEVFWLDSIVRKAVDSNVKIIVNGAIKVAIIEMGKTIKENPTWELVKCPAQKGTKECSVYVMKFMKHLMEDPLASTKSKLKELGKAMTYGDKELNNLRLELLEYILDFITNGE